MNSNAAPTTFPASSTKPVASVGNSANDTGESSTDVTGMVSDISLALEAAISDLRSVNAETKMLSLNARIESGRAGVHGTAFAVVAEEMQTLAHRTASIADEMAMKTREKTSALIGLIESAIRGTRLSDLALVNIDLIDRCLYERTCDVRWWATDGSLVDGLKSKNPDDLAFAGKRLGVILDAYTVYHDLVLCDTSGAIVANGRPEQYGSVGQNVHSAPWFSAAMRSASGGEYGFQTAHASNLVNDKQSLIYSCGVRENGNAHGSLLGALGILFNWDELAQPILTEIPVEPHERDMTEAYIIDRDGLILASNQNVAPGSVLELPELKQIFGSPKGFYQTSYRGSKFCVGHAKAPGFETYSTGWYSLILQPIRD